MIEGFELPPDWPRMSLAEVDALLTAPGARFEMAEAVIRGLPTRIWKNAPPSLPFLLAHSRSHGERTAWILEDERVSFEATYRAAATLAAELSRLGVGKGDRVAIAMANLPEWPVAFFAATALGAIAVPLNAWWTGPELEYGLADSGAKALICDAPRHARIAPHLGALPDLEHVIVSRAEKDDRLED
ncbi:MAG: steroid-24-oyl-CoA synthetase, partial [Sphingomonadales bacterium]|nr:steroid-24-oyl-CoA synthetase [Sphingomonadales bacterium]